MCKLVTHILQELWTKKPNSYSVPYLVCVSIALRPMDNDLCLGIPLNTTQLCHISCPVECEVSLWSAWGPCTFENCLDQAAKKGKNNNFENYSVNS